MLSRKKSYKWQRQQRRWPKMKFVDKIVEVSNRPRSTEEKRTAKILPVFVFFFLFPALLFLIPNFVLDQWLHLPTIPNLFARVIIATILIVVGVVFLLWTLKAQREIGKGTPMPLMATQKLVIQKPYSYCRNPLAFGLLNFYFGISILIGSISSLILVLIFAIVILAYIKFVEEKELEQRYGEEYVAYKQNTPFLIPWRSRK